MLSIIRKENIIHILRQTLSMVAPRLISHGERVSYIVLKMLQYEGKHPPPEILNRCMLAIVHDIGAYKTEEIDRMVEFETESVWDHSIYGYLFVKNLTPLAGYADALLFHHLPWKDFDKVTCKNRSLASMLHLADRIDLYHESGAFMPENAFFASSRDTSFSGEQIDLFLDAEQKLQILSRLKQGRYLDELIDLFEHGTFTEEELSSYLRMMVFAIDFRSESTVTHTITTVAISLAIAGLMGYRETDLKKIYFGALLHDLGKIKVPLSILEKPGRLTAEEMQVMQTHILYTEDVLKNYIDPEVYAIAVRHHEKLDGSGYPRGLCAQDLTTPQRIVASADIMSALTGKRSYKKAYSKETVLAIMDTMCRENKLCPQIGDVISQNYDRIMQSAMHNFGPVLSTYNSIMSDYAKIKEAVAIYD